MTPLLQWTGSGFSLELGALENRIKTITSGHTSSACWQEGWGSSKLRVCHASQRPTQVFAVWGLRSRSSSRPADETWPAPQAAGAAVPGAGNAARETGRIGDPGGIAQQTLAADDRGF